MMEGGKLCASFKRNQDSEENSGENQQFSSPTTLIYRKKKSHDITLLPFKPTGLNYPAHLFFSFFIYSLILFIFTNHNFTSSILIKIHDSNYFSFFNFKYFDTIASIFIILYLIHTFFFNKNFILGSNYFQFYTYKIEFDAKSIPT